MKKVITVIMIAVLVTGALSLMAPTDVLAKKPVPPFPLPCDHCEPTLKIPPCICHLIDCTPWECAYTCTCW